MLTEICSYLKNYFSEPKDRHFGRFEIKDGAITPSAFLQEGQFFRIVGSTFNDGVYEYPCAGLKNETYEGAIWAMKVPPELKDLASEIESYEAEKSKAIAEGGWDMFKSQSFAGYSGTVKDEADISWQKQYAPRLNRWRRL